ncbi:MAG: hypothetical protein WB560_13470 [Desulfobaccales bacterium]
MSGLQIETLSPSLQQKISPFFHEILDSAAPRIHSLYLVGSVLTEDYLEGVSDLNSIIVLGKMDLDFLDVLAPLGPKYGKTGLAAPWVMDPGYIQGSVDVFPLEFLSLKLVHHTLYGEDLLGGLKFDRRELRFQCERELLGKLLWLRRIYVSAMGDHQVLAADIVRHSKGYLPLFRGILHLLGESPASSLKKSLEQLVTLTGADLGVFAEISAIKKNLSKPSKEEISGLFENLYRATERLAEVVDGIKIE